MVGTKAGSIKAQNTMRKKLGDNYNDFFRTIGKKGGKNGYTGGFYGNPEKASECGRKGGLISRRTGVKNGEGKRWTKQ